MEWPLERDVRSRTNILLKLGEIITCLYAIGNDVEERKLS